MNIHKGSVVLMKAESGLKGYGNAQCVSWVSHELGELSLYGHNEHYKAYHVAKIVEQGERMFTLKEALGIWKACYDWHHDPESPDKKEYFKQTFGIDI